MEKSSFPHFDMPNMYNYLLIFSLQLDPKLMFVHNLTFHQEVQSLRGTVTVDLWTLLFFSI